MPDAVPPEPQVKPPVCRRRFLGLLALTGVGALVTREYDPLKKIVGDLRDLCANLDWPGHRDQILTASAKAYGEFLERQNFARLPVSVILAPHFNRHGKVQNSIPPADLWKNILPTLKVADRLAKELGEKIHINSAYRSPAYNATCPGAVSSSQHLRNVAVDMWFESPSAEVAKLARKLRGQGLFLGGVGLYPAFTHIDTRGRNADW